MSSLNVNTLLNQINAADQKQAEAQYTIANILTAIKDHRLYEDADYPSFKAMCQGELSFSVSTAERYVNLYNDLTRLRYNKKESIEMIRRFNWRALGRVLEEADRKLGVRAIQNQIDIFETDGELQMNFTVFNKQSRARLDSVLARYGMEISASGRRMGVSRAMEAMVEDLERRTAVNETRKKRGDLKSVA